MKQGSKRRLKAPDLRKENESLRLRLEEAEEMLQAIRRGEIDGLVVESPKGKRVYTLKGADESYRTLVEAMSEGALILEPTGTILYANRRFAEIVDTPLSQVIGSSILGFVQQGLHEAYHQLIGHGGAAPAQQEMVLTRPDQKPVPVLLSAGPISIEERVGIAVLVTDLTEQKERDRARTAERKLAEDQIRLHAASLEKTNRALEVTNQELEAFVYSVSHDLRAPLRSVHRYGTMILEDHGQTLSPEVKDQLTPIIAAAQRMDDLIRDLLAYTHVSRQEVTLRPVETASVAAEVLKHLDQEIRDRSAEVKVEAPLPGVVGDAVLLSQALTNLVSNGIKFVAPGKPPRLRIHAESRGVCVRLWVDDNGIGIPPDEQGRLFRVFERLNLAYPGTGIGLAIVKRAVERMGGSVGVESRAGEGSRFWMELGTLGGARR
jgi:PAS domain S-box-containing protein